MRYQSYESPITLLDLLSSVARYKWRVLLVTAAMLVVSAAVIFLLPKRYQSEAKLFVRLGRGSASMDPATVGQTIAIQESRETEMNSITDMLESRALAESVVDSVGTERLLKKYAWVEQQIEATSDWAAARLAGLLSAKSEEETDGGETLSDSVEVKVEEPSLEERKRYELAVREVEENLRVDSPKRSTTIGIAYRAREPELARDVVQAVIENYRQMHISAYQSQGALEFFDQQYNEQAAIVADTENELREKKNANQVVTVAGKQAQIQSEITDVKKMQLETQAALQETLAKVAQLQTSIQQTDSEIVSQKTSGIASNAADGMRNRLYELEIQEKELASKYVDSDPRLMRVREQIADARRIAETQPQERPQSVLAVNPVRQELENDLLAAQSSIAGLRAKLEALDTIEGRLLARLEDVNDLEVESQEMERRIEIARSNHRNYAIKLEESRINAALDDESLSNVSVVGGPNIRYKHVSPRRSVLAAVGAVFSLFCGFLVALISDYGRHSREVAVIRKAEREAYLRRLQNAKEILEHPVALEPAREKANLSSNLPEDQSTDAADLDHSADGVDGSDTPKKAR